MYHILESPHRMGGGVASQLQHNTSAIFGKKMAQQYFELCHGVAQHSHVTRSTLGVQVDEHEG